MILLIFFYKQKTAYEMRISDWSSDVCSSDLRIGRDRDRGNVLAVPAEIEVLEDRLTAEQQGVAQRASGELGGGVEDGLDLVGAEVLVLIAQPKLLAA